jgi:hypothetical protein
MGCFSQKDQNTKILGLGLWQLVQTRFLDSNLPGLAVAFWPGFCTLPFGMKKKGSVGSYIIQIMQ